MEKKPFSDISYDQYLNEDKLMGSKCNQCGSVFTPPRPICIDCHSSDMEWAGIKGTGKLAGFTCITIGPSFMAEEGYDRNNPYCVGVVELDEGTRVDARIEGVDAGKPETIKVGMPLKVKFLHRGEGDNQRTFLAFEPI
jgi:scaffold protein (connect acetoacetyl-CoA thiolase and HMG-CoA synthase)